MAARDTASSSRACITGLGFVSPLGHDLESVWPAFIAGSTLPVQHAHRLHNEVWGSFPLFRVEAFEPRALPWSDSARAALDGQALWADTDLLYLAAAALRALEDAGFDPAAPPGDLGLVLTHENPGVDRHVDALLDAFHDVRNAATSPDSRSAAADALYAQQRDRVYDLQTFMPLHRLARLLGVHGHGIFLNNACASGLYALDTAALLLASGRCRAVVVAGADHPTSFTKYRWFRDQGLAAEDGVMRPFDRQHHGFVLGDGAAAVVLESTEAVRSRGVRAYAAYRGGGFNQEAWKVTLPDPSSGHYTAVLASALREAGLEPGDVDWLVAHGAATSVADAYEARSLVAVFGPEFERPRLTGFKPYVGHNLGGSGVTETALLLLAMRHGALPPLRGCEEPDPALRLRPLGSTAAEEPRFAVKCAAGFGGFNAACVFERLD
jgi:3-oxoacyl-[acyl-carrier-protein] synthase II